MESKFKVGDTVRMKCRHDIRFFIIEVTVQVCYANCEQTWYTGRLFGTEKFSNVQKGYDKFSEIELEAIPQKSESYLKAVALVAEKKKAKEEAIKAQDFELGSRLSDEERAAKLELEIHPENDNSID